MEADMKSAITIVGLILVILGIVTLGYQGFTYTKQEKVAEVGNIQITADTEKHVRIPPILGGTSIVVGVVLIAVARMRMK
jgi:uncharacterized membrane protein